MGLNNLIFVSPSTLHKEVWQNFNAEFEAKGERIVPGIARSGDGTFETFLSTVINLKNGINIPPQFVQSTTYFLLDEKQAKLIGVTSIRHYLNESLLKIGGHIGYGVTPSERRKGYATMMLSLALEKCRELGIEKALVTCDKSNIGSAKTILKNGGVLENEYTEENGNIVQRYWITL